MGVYLVSKQKGLLTSIPALLKAYLPFILPPNPIASSTVLFLSLVLDYEKGSAGQGIPKAPYFV